MGTPASGPPQLFDFPERRRRGRRRTQGSALAEFAIVWFPLFALLFGIADVSRLIFMRNMLQNGVREAVRQASTYQLSPHAGDRCASMSECVKAAVQKNTLGFLTGTIAGRPAESFIQIDYYAPDRLGEPLKAADLPRQVNGRRIEHLNQPGNLIEVRVENYPLNWMVPLPVGYLGGTGLVFSVAASEVLQEPPSSSSASSSSWQSATPAWPAQ